MFILTHAAIGSVIAEAFPTHPFVAFVLAFLAHFPTDVIPHGDTGLYKGYLAGTKVKTAYLFVGIDAVATVLSVIYLLTKIVFDHRLAITMVIVGGVLPDILVALYEIFRPKWLRWFHRLHFYFHNLISGKVGDLSLQNGIALEFVVLALLVYKLV